MRSSIAFALSLMSLLLGAQLALSDGRQPESAKGLAAESARIDLDDLLRAFREMPGLEASFTEEKRLALLARPLMSEGKLYILPNRALLRVVERPKRSETLIIGSTLILREGGREERMDLRSMHAIRPLVEGLLMLFTGKRAELERVFTLSFGQDADRWELELFPKDAALAHLLERMSITGSGYLVERVTIKERSGDESVMRILSADPRRNFDARERAALFGDAGS